MADIASLFARHEIYFLIFILATLTFITRIGGYLVLARFERIPKPIKAGLEAVPAAVITTLVVPPAISAGPAEMTALVVATIACFRLTPILVILLGLTVLVGMRQLGLG